MTGIHISVEGALNKPITRVLETPKLLTHVERGYLDSVVVNGQCLSERLHEAGLAEPDMCSLGLAVPGTLAPSP